MILVAFLLIRTKKKVIQPNIELEIPFESLVRAIVKLDPQQKQQLLQILGGEVATAGVVEAKSSLQAQTRQTTSQLSLRRPAATPSRGAGRDRNMRQLKSPREYPIEEHAPLDEFML